MYSNTFCRVGAAATVAVLSIAAAKALYRYYQEKQETKKWSRIARQALSQLPQDAASSSASEDQIEIVDYDQARDELVVKEDIVDKNVRALAPWGLVMNHLKNDKTHRALVIRKAGKTIGFITYCLFRNPNEKAKGETNWCIRFLGISEDYRRKGYGTRLIQTAGQELINKGITILDITVVYANERAQNLYGLLGFEVQKDKDPYHEVYLMRIQLDNKNQTDLLFSASVYTHKS